MDVLYTIDGLPLLHFCNHSSFPFTVLWTTPGNKGTFPRTKKVSTGHFFTPVCGLVPFFQVPHTKRKGHPFGCPSLLVGEAGLEPARPQ